ncbi:very short patch repair endonuclease [Dehalococcoides mccartyi]|uniref:very short patch repair endonuclease n=1 Tax=Dehalococcoides mccartyi TaxID=61435 RepID=UPI0009B70A2A|nr:DNA mismatch endonuclease Vsr [Dehalococcoides mccartyi]
MADNHSPQVRSYNMSRIRSKNTKPEAIVRSYLFSVGFRFRKNDKRYLGKPDIVLPKYKTIVFVHGCFWHCHENCSDFVLPKSHSDYWLPKLERNRIRDAENVAELRKIGWRVMIVWECELKKDCRQEKLEKLATKICQ